MCFVFTPSLIRSKYTVATPSVTASKYKKLFWIMTVSLVFVLPLAAYSLPAVLAVYTRNQGVSISPCEGHFIIVVVLNFVTHFHGSSHGAAGISTFAQDMPIPVSARPKACVSAIRLLGLRVRMPPGVWMSVSCECFVLSSRGLCDGSITG